MSTNTSHALWHPFADMGSVDGDRMVITRAEGPWVWDDGGRRYLDATAALWYANLGHGRHEIADAVARQLRTLDAYSHLRRLRERAGAGARRPAGRARAGARQPRLPRLRRRRLDRDRGQARAQLPRADGRAADVCTSSAGPAATTARTASARASAGSPPTPRASEPLDRRRLRVPHDDVAGARGGDPARRRRTASPRSSASR